MYLKGTFLAALAATATAQSNLINTLKSDPDLSNLTSLISADPTLASTLNSLSNVTVLAPNNAAIMKLMNSSLASMITQTPGLLQAVLMYHILNGTYSNITNTTFVHTALMNQSYTNVTGGQVVEATSNMGNITFFSGLLMNSSVTSKMAMNFSGGVAHVIDSVLTLPQNLTATAIDFNLTSAVGALEQVPMLAEGFNTHPNLTLFVPNNDAFQAIGSALPNLTMAQLKSILSYHCVEQVLYSTMLMNDTMYMTTEGANLTVRMEDDNVYVNSAKVVIPNVLIANGVVHVIDEVLNPMNTTVMPNPSMTAPAFAGASSASNVPYTSGVPTPTMTIDTSQAAGGMMSATGGSSSSSGGAWMPKATGAMGAAALFGGAAVMMNM